MLTTPDPSVALLGGKKLGVEKLAAKSKVALNADSASDQSDHSAAKKAAAASTAKVFYLNNITGPEGQKSLAFDMGTKKGISDYKALRAQISEDPTKFQFQGRPFSDPISLKQIAIGDLMAADVSRAEAVEQASKMKFNS